MKKQTLQEWMEKVDEQLRKICGLTSSDLADQRFGDWHEEGVTPAQAAKRMLREEGFYE
jgi:hypothetical protein